MANETLAAWTLLAFTSLFSVIGLTPLILVAAPTIVGRIGRTGQQVVDKIMALITTVIGMQFIINGATTVALDVLRAVKGGA